jgi:hypothetical protein
MKDIIMIVIEFVISLVLYMYRTHMDSIYYGVSRKINNIKYEVRENLKPSESATLLLLCRVWIPSVELLPL